MAVIPIIYIYSYIPCIHIVGTVARGTLAEMSHKNVYFYVLSPLKKRFSPLQQKYLATALFFIYTNKQLFEIILHVGRCLSPFQYTATHNDTISLFLYCNLHITDNILHSINEMIVFCSLFLISWGKNGIMQYKLYSSNF